MQAILSYSTSYLRRQYAFCSYCWNVLLSVWWPLQSCVAARKAQEAATDCRMAMSAGPQALVVLSSAIYGNLHMACVLSYV